MRIAQNWLWPRATHSGTLWANGGQGVVSLSVQWTVAGNILSVAGPSAWFPAGAGWIYGVTGLVLFVGLAFALRNSLARGDALERVLVFGNLFYAVPLAVFGIQHFTARDVVVQAVPAWMPGRWFWTAFVGIALLCSAASLVTGILARWASLLTGIMLFLFVLMIYLPILARVPYDRFVWASGFRDLALSGGALAWAASNWAPASTRWARRLVETGRLFFAVPVLFFALEHFLHPQSAPGVPLELQMPGWYPLHTAWGWSTGIVLLCCGVAMVIKKQADWAATMLGLWFLLLCVAVYLPMQIVHPSIEISGELDYLADTLAMGGAALFVACSLRDQAPAEVSTAFRPHLVQHR